VDKGHFACVRKCSLSRWTQAGRRHVDGSRSQGASVHLRHKMPQSGRYSRQRGQLSRAVEGAADSSEHGRG